MHSKLKFLIKYMHQYRWWYAGGIVFLILTVWVSVTIPLYIQRSIDMIGSHSSAGRAGFYENILIIAGLALGLILVRTLSRILVFVPARMIEKEIKGEMFRKLTSFGKEYYDLNPTGSIISRVNNDINGVRMITGFGVLQIGNVLLSLTITPYKMWQLSPMLTLYCILPIIVVFSIVRIGIAVMVKNTHHRMEILQKLSGKTVSFLSGNNVIKNYNIYSYAEDEVHKENISLFDKTMKITWVRSFILPLLGSLGQILKIVVLFAGGIYVIKGIFSIGELTEYIAYATLLTGPIMGLGWLLSVFQQGFVGINSLQTIMNRKGVDDGREPLSLQEREQLFKDGITVKNLHFTYHNGSKPVLKDISFKVEPGQIIGITGKVGSGKTTLINCLNGFLRPEEGQVFFGEKDAAFLRGDDIRSVVKTVTQEVFLFSDTIENNVIFGSEKSFFRDSFEDVIYKSAFADELSRLPMQGKTPVGEKGIMLSGGQKQRISLARALYTSCELLILDDVFSAVDSETERFLIREVVNYHVAKSVIVISNRISVLEKTDFTIVLEDGRITAQGNHKQLMESSGFYRNILNLQKEGNLKNSAVK